MENVIDADGMFMRAKFKGGTPKFENCQNINLAKKMFYESDLSFMPSMNLKTATDI